MPGAIGASTKPDTTTLRRTLAPARGRGRTAHRGDGERFSRRTGPRRRAGRPGRPAPPSAGIRRCPGDRRLRRPGRRVDPVDVRRANSSSRPCWYPVWCPAAWRRRPPFGCHRLVTSGRRTRRPGRFPRAASVCCVEQAQ